MSMFLSFAKSDHLTILVFSQHRYAYSVTVLTGATLFEAKLFYGTFLMTG